MSEARDRDAAFDAWLHSEAGYTYVGPTSIYRLTIPEMARLHRGFEVMNEERREQVESEANLSPGQRNYGRVRDGDQRALKEFADEHNLKQN